MAPTTLISYIDTFMRTIFCLIAVLSLSAVGCKNVCQDAVARAQACYEQVCPSPDAHPNCPHLESVLTAINGVELRCDETLEAQLGALQGMSCQALLGLE